MVVGVRAVMAAYDVGVPRKGPTFEQIGELSGYTGNSVASWARGEHDPRVSSLDTVLGVFDFELAIRRRLPDRNFHRIEPSVLFSDSGVTPGGAAKAKKRGGASKNRAGAEASLLAAP